MKNMRAEAERAAAEKNLQGEWKPRELLGLLEELNQLDVTAEARMKRATNVAMVGGVGAFLMVFVAIAVALFWETGWAFAAIPVFLAVLGWGIWRHKKAKRLDIPNELRKVVRPVVRRLAEDLAAGEKITVEADLSGMVEGKKGKGLYRRKVQGGNMAAYEDRLLRMEMALVDGATAVLELSNSYFLEERQKSTASGKTKWKRKWRKMAKATATLLPAGPAEWRAGPVDAGWEKLRLVNRSGSQGARLTKYWEWKGEGEPPGQTPPVSEVLGLFARLAQMRRTG